VVESLSHPIQVLGREGLKTDIDRDTATLCKSLQEFLIKGDGDGGMAIPKEVEFSKKGKKFKTKPLVPCDVGIDDVKKPSFEKIRKVFAQ
jgi:hypothetical protein